MRRRFAAGIASKSDADATLHAMADLLVDAAHKQPVGDVARRIVAGIHGRRQADQARAIRSFVSTRLRFVRDPRFMELLGDPTHHLVEIDRRGFVHGDCDDAATLAGALALSIGIPVRLEAVAFGVGAPYSHVYAVADVMQDGALATIDFDTTAEDHAEIRANTRRLVELILAPDGRPAR